MEFILNRFLVALWSAGLAVFFCSCSSSESYENFSRTEGVGVYSFEEAFLNEAAFLYPLESRNLLRSLSRRQFVFLENQKFNFVANEAEIRSNLQEARNRIVSNLSSQETIDNWSYSQYGLPWTDVESAIRERLKENQIYQFCVRAWSLHQKRVRLRLGASKHQSDAESWVRRLESGAHPDLLAAESIDSGMWGDAPLLWLPFDLPTPLGDLLAELDATGGVSGRTIGPFRFSGENLWRVAWVEKIEHPLNQAINSTFLLSALREDPISLLESEAWFSAMLERYTATPRFLEVTALSPHL